MRIVWWWLSEVEDEDEHEDAVDEQRWGSGAEAEGQPRRRDSGRSRGNLVIPLVWRFRLACLDARLGGGERPRSDENTVRWIREVCMDASVQWRDTYKLLASHA